MSLAQYSTAMKSVLDEACVAANAQLVTSYSTRQVHPTMNDIRGAGDDEADSVGGWRERVRGPGAGPNSSRPALRSLMPVRYAGKKHKTEEYTKCFNWWLLADVIAYYNVTVPSQAVTWDFVREGIRFISQEAVGKRVAQAMIELEAAEPAHGQDVASVAIDAHKFEVTMVRATSLQNAFRDAVPVDMPVGVIAAQQLQDKQFLGGLPPLLQSCLHHVRALSRQPVRRSLTATCWVVLPAR